MGGGGRRGAQSTDPEKSISAEYLIEFERHRFEPPAWLDGGRGGVLGGHRGLGWGGRNISEGLGTSAALSPLEAACL